MPAKILLADDSITIQKIVHQTFEHEPFELVLVGNGEAAIRQAEELHPDLILADIFMPGKDGYEVCHYVKQQPALASIPVILLVGAFEPFDEKEATRVHADGHLKKPFAPKMLLEAVHRYLPKESTPVTPVAAAGSVPPKPEAAPEVPAGARWHAGQTQIVPSAVPEKIASPAQVPESEVPPRVTPPSAEPVLEEPPLGMQPAVEASAEALEFSAVGETEAPLEISHLAEARPAEEIAELAGAVQTSEVSGIENLEQEVAGPWPPPPIEKTPASVPVEELKPEEAAATEGREEPKSESAEGHLLSEEFVDFQLDLVRHSIEDGRPFSEASKIQEAKSAPAAEERTAATMEELIGAAPPSIEETVAAAAEEQEGRSAVPVELSEEVIDAIARRVVEKMSSRVIEEIAWEVVPEMAEALLRKKISEDK
jgi:CheY-like chemotaxis protein